MAGRRLAENEVADLWTAWTPSEVARRMLGVVAPWHVAGGWALELFTGDAARQHADIEIGIPATRFDEVVAALPGFEWDVAGDGTVWPFPEESGVHHQTWLRDPATGRYLLDVFREPQVGDRWACRRDPSITMAYPDLILHTRDGIPYAAPEVVLLFKAKHLRDPNT
ncbi:MAG: hypothetical protein JWR11_1854 [Mycobacterium sp.]|nr:hypothetical protein [Mycobacterium sp.]